MFMLTHNRTSKGS